MDILGLTLAGAFALGTGLLAAWGLVSLHALFVRVRQFAQPRWILSLEALLARREDEADAEEDEKTGRDWILFLPALGGVGLAFLARDWLLSPYLTLLGLTPVPPPAPLTANVPSGYNGGGSK